MPDGSRFYVASYVTGTGSACLDPTVTSPTCVIPQVTVYDAPSLSVKTTIFPLFVPPRWWRENDEEDGRDEDEDGDRRPPAPTGLLSG